MELDALSITCRHLRNERDCEMVKLAKQKHAAHMRCCRMRYKLRRLELANSLLLVALTGSEVHNNTLKARIRAVVEAESGLHELI